MAVSHFVFVVLMNQQKENLEDKNNSVSTFFTKFVALIYHQKLKINRTEIYLRNHNSGTTTEMKIGLGLSGYYIKN
jgi:hypothetical protein